MLLLLLLLFLLMMITIMEVCVRYTSVRCWNTMSCCVHPFTSHQEKWDLDWHFLIFILRFYVYWTFFSQMMKTYEMVIKPDVMPVFRFMLHLQWNGRIERHCDMEKVPDLKTFCCTTFFLFHIHWRRIKRTARIE